MTHSDSPKRPHLGVNIDHVATLREARQTYQPEPLHAALEAERGGADSVVLHVRKDRRHVNERDLRLLVETVQSRVNLEMALEEEMINIAEDHSPWQVTLVPEDREEVTTEGGLDAEAHGEMLQEATGRLKEQNIRVHLFIDPIRSQLETAREVGADGIELHTGEYAEAEKASENERVREALSRLSEAAVYGQNLGLTVSAGHGLTYQNVFQVAAIPEIEELNIGHSIVSRSVVSGMHRAVEEMRSIIDQARGQ